jgi:hypothetical protein
VRRALIHQLDAEFFLLEKLMNARALSKMLGLLLFFSSTAYAGGNKIVGTYSTLTYNKESGDLNGLEISIVPTDEGLIAAVQMAGDGINEIHLAKIDESLGNMQFSVRLDDSGKLDFSMRCTLNACKGEYVWGQAKVRFSLLKSNGYWNKR